VKLNGRFPSQQDNTLHCHSLSPMAHLGMLLAWPGPAELLKLWSLHRSSGPQRPHQAHFQTPFRLLGPSHGPESSSSSYPGSFQHTPVWLESTSLTSPAFQIAFYLASQYVEQIKGEILCLYLWEPDSHPSYTTLTTIHKHLSGTPKISQNTGLCLHILFYI
jgi:hypothetical protein